MQDEFKARIGMVNFINTAALYEVWKESVQRPEWQVVEAAPAVLNRLLRSGDLDLGFVSSYEYAEHPAGFQAVSAAAAEHDRGPKKITLEHVNRARRALTLAGLPLSQRAPRLMPEYTDGSGSGPIAFFNSGIDHMIQ